MKESQQLRFHLTSNTTSLSELFLLRHLLPNLQPLPSQPSKSELLYTIKALLLYRLQMMWAEGGLLPWGIGWLCPEWLPEGIKLREVKVRHTAVFPMLPLNYQRQHSKEQVGDTSDHTGFCVVSTPCPVQTMFIKDLMRWAKVRMPKGLQTIECFGRDL